MCNNHLTVVVGEIPGVAKRHRSNVFFVVCFECLEMLFGSVCVSFQNAASELFECTML